MLRLTYLETTAERTQQNCYAMCAFRNFLYADVLPSEPYPHPQFYLLYS
jgi:hypothetical protein